MPNLPPPLSLAVLASTLAVGGAERQLATLARELRARGHHLAFYLLRARGAVGAELEGEGFRLEEKILARPARWRRALAELRRCDLLAALDHNNLLRLLPALAPSLPPYVVLYHLPLPGTRPRGWLRALRRAYAVVAVAEAQVPMLALPPSCRVEVIPNGVPLPPPPTPEDRRRARETLALPPEATVAATACRLTSVKGVDVLVEALAALPEAERPFAAVAGDGPEKTRLEETARAQLGVGYKFFGGLAEVAPLYQAADFFVLPSYREATPMALLEAMSYGLPAIAGAVGDVGVILGDAGATFTPGEAAELAAAIRTMTASRALRLEQGARARAAVADRYTVRHMVERYEALFREAAPREGKDEGP
jgi:glycosyltransferase involved in cell wall biosynthesis